jgi:hypothetical protein
MPPIHRPLGAALRWPKSLASLFDHLIGSRKQRRGGLETEHLGSNQVNYEIEFGRLLDRKVGRLRSAQNLVVGCVADGRKRNLPDASGGALELC